MSDVRQNRLEEAMNAEREHIEELRRVALERLLKRALDGEMALEGVSPQPFDDPDEDDEDLESCDHIADEEAA